MFEKPPRADIRWADIEALFRVMGAEIGEGEARGCGSRSTAFVPCSFGRYPQRITDKGTVGSSRRFLEATEI